MRRSLLRPVKRLLSPRGTGGILDRLALAAWDGYAYVKGMPAVPGQYHAANSASALPSVSDLPYTSAFFLEHMGAHLLSFWEQHGIDREFGGFLTHLDRAGRHYEDEFKISAMQARMLVSFLMGYDALREPRYLEQAQQGLCFLRANMWDDEHGGFFRSVQRDGSRRVADKELFDQAYVLLGLAEYYRVVRDEAVLGLAWQTYDRMDAHAWDARDGGYVEACQRDWTVKSSDKTLCVQLDSLLAILALYEATGDERCLARLRQLAQVLERMRAPRHGCLLERFRRNWVYHPVPKFDQIEFGHNLKAAWLLLRLYRHTREEGHLACARRLLDFSLDFGWDGQHGGFYQFGFRGGRLASRVKIWWPECEGLLALLLMHRVTGEARYVDFFRRLAAFTFAHFFDAEHGEWFAACEADGRPNDDRKGHMFKSAYHPVQVCYEVGRYMASAPNLTSPPALP